MALISLRCSLYGLIVLLRTQKGKQKSPGRATRISRSQPLTPGGREKVTLINMCIANKQMHDKHEDQLPLLDGSED